jgi:hypothetical protein
VKHPPISVTEQLSGLIKPAQSLELLQALHILTPDGRINQDSRRKLKQINHLAQFVEPLLTELQTTRTDQALTLVDHGAGKAYLGFVLFDLFLRDVPNVQVWGIEQRPELIDKAQKLARQMQFHAMHFFAGSTHSALTAPELPQRVDLVTALHACDTATDDAIAFGIQKSAKYLVIVPCCQAEVARTLRQYKNVMLGQTALAELWRHPIHTREIGAQITNVLRTLQLQAAGYDVTVTELVGWEHSLKNELIIATYNKSNQGSQARAAQDRLHALLSTFGLTTLSNRFSSTRTYD